MTDIKERLVDGMRGQGIRLPDGDWLRLDDENLGLIADRLLSTPGIAITALPNADSTRYEGEFGSQDRLCWMPGDDFEVSVWHPGEIQRCGFGWNDAEPISVYEARTVAAALLAAAVQAQEEQP